MAQHASAMLRMKGWRGEINMFSSAHKLKLWARIFQPLESYILISLPVNASP